MAIVFSDLWFYYSYLNEHPNIKEQLEELHNDYITNNAHLFGAKSSYFLEVFNITGNTIEE